MSAHPIQVRLQVIPAEDENLNELQSTAEMATVFDQCMVLGCFLLHYGFVT